MSLQFVYPILYYQDYRQDRQDAQDEVLTF